jgi:hypothetical protein
MITRRLDVDVTDAPFDPDSPRRVVEVREKDGVKLYHVYIWLQGPHVPFVRGVEYNLHPSFDPPVRVVERTSENPNCELDFWTPGVFEVKATVTDVNGRPFQIFHPLTFNKAFEKEQWDKSGLTQRNA